MKRDKNKALFLPAVHVGGHMTAFDSKLKDDKNNSCSESTAKFLVCLTLLKYHIIIWLQSQKSCNVPTLVSGGDDVETMR